MVFSPEMEVSRNHLEGWEVVPEGVLPPRVVTESLDRP